MNLGLMASGACSGNGKIGGSAAIDYSNLVVRNGGRPGVLNASALDRDLRQNGVNQVVVLAASFFPKEVRRFSRLGWKCIQTGHNADPEILEYARRFIRRSCEHLVVVSGDGKLGLDILSEAEPRQVDVSFWSLSWKLSNSLRDSGSKVRVIDHLVATPRVNDFHLLAQSRRPIAGEQAPYFSIH